MPYTTCPYCNKRAYSAADLDSWICPYCNKEIKKEDKDKDNVKKTGEQGE